MHRSGGTTTWEVLAESFYRFCDVAMFREKKRSNRAVNEKLYNVFHSSKSTNCFGVVFSHSVKTSAGQPTACGTTATASTSISHSGRTNLRMTTKVLAGGAEVFT